MLNYTNEQIRIIIGNIFNTKKFNIEPVGNHELKRHLVYLIEFEDKNPLIFKLYYKENRRSREIGGLSILADSEMKCPKIIKQGILKNGKEWLIIEAFEGQPFEKVMKDISHENQLEIFESMGEEMGKMHSAKKFLYFGRLDENGKPLGNIKDYYEKHIKDCDNIVEEINKQELLEKELLLKAIEIMRKNYDLIKKEKEARLCHSDFDGRNVLVKKERDKWILSAVIDFEGCAAGNKDEDMINLYQKYFIHNPKLEKAFFKGYNQYCSVDKDFYEVLDYLLLCTGIGICSWARYQAPDYYREGIKLIKKQMNKYK